MTVDRCHDVCRLLEPLTRCMDGNRLELMSDGEDYVPAMIGAIDSARVTIDLELYRVDPGHLWQMFSKALTDAAARRVRVRLLVDSFGSRRMLEADWQKAARGGIQVRRTPTVLRCLVTTGSTRRDHRKLLVVDREVAFTGGMSIDDVFFRPGNEPTWRESMVRAHGPIVEVMQNAFGSAWGEAEEDARRTEACSANARAQLLLSALGKPRGEELFLRAIAGAQRFIWITNPFVVPSARISKVLFSAVKRGVDVRLLVPGRFIAFRWCSTPRAVFTHDISPPVYAFSNMTRRCCTPRPSWSMAIGPQSDHSTSTLAASFPTMKWRSSPVTRHLRVLWVRRSPSTANSRRRSSWLDGEIAVSETA